MLCIICRLSVTIGNTSLSILLFQERGLFDFCAEKSALHALSAARKTLAKRCKLKAARFLERLKLGCLAGVASPASLGFLLSIPSACGCNEIYHLKQPILAYSYYSTIILVCKVLFCCLYNFSNGCRLFSMRR